MNLEMVNAMAEKVPRMVMTDLICKEFHKTLLFRIREVMGMVV